MWRSGRKAGAMERGMLRTLHHDEHIAREVLARDEPGRVATARETADAEAAALAERVALEPAVTPDHAAVLGLDRAGPSGQPLPHELAEGTLSDEADSGRVALLRDRQPTLSGNGADLALAQVPDGELAGCVLLRIQRVQEIALVLVAVDAAQEPAPGTDAGIVACRVTLRSEPPSVVEADAKLHLAVAEDVGVRRAAGLELREKVREDAFAVLGREARLVQRDPEHVADPERVLEVGRRRAVAVVVLGPVRHEEGFDAMAGVEEERRGDRGIHAARERNDDASHRSACRRTQREGGCGHAGQEPEGVAHAAQVVVDAEQHQRASMLGGASRELLALEPERSDDRAVEAHRGVPLPNPTRESDTQDRAPGRSLPQVDTGDGIGSELAARFFARLAHDRLGQRLAGLQVARGLVQHDAARGALLHEQEPSATLGDGRDGDVEFPGHAAIIRSGGRAPAAAQRCCWRVSASGSLAIQISSK